jgi:hypothetical protein
MAFQIGAGVGDEREAGGVRFGEAVERERGDGENNFFLRLVRNLILCHSGAQPSFDFFHARLRPFESHGAAQVFGFAAGEVGGNHRQAQQLFLKKRYAESALQHWLE